MSDKTCGACAHGKPALVKCSLHSGKFPWLKKQREKCEDFAERADSVEQIVHEWNGWCLFQGLDPEPYIDRLQDLGVI